MQHSLWKNWLSKVRIKKGIDSPVISSTKQVKEKVVFIWRSIQSVAQSALRFAPWQTCSFRHQLAFSYKNSSHAVIKREDILLSHFHHRL